MTLPRRQLVCVDQTPYYHCVSRCVRRAYLCGRDRWTGKSFSHRRGWIERRLQTISKIFSIDVLAYAIMENHYHLVLRIDVETAKQWSDAEVVERWSCLYRLPALLDPDKNAFFEGQTRLRRDLTATWRSRLTDLGWFMRSINEPLARLANREDDCTGRFWESRYRSQALLDRSAVLRCMAYVDLNPVRAGLSRNPRRSLYTAIRARIEGRAAHLASFSHDGRKPSVVPTTFRRYLELLDWTARALRTARRGSIQANAPPLLAALDLPPGQWIRSVERKKSFQQMALGSLQRLRAYRAHLRKSGTYPATSAPA